MKLKTAVKYDDGKEFPAVSLAGIKDEMWLAHKVMHDVLREHGYETKITAGTEVARCDEHIDGHGDRCVSSIHSDTSAHPWGYAIDYSRKAIKTELEAVQIQVEVQRRLDNIKEGYQVILHRSHFHVEYDRRLKEGLK